MLDSMNPREYGQALAILRPREVQELLGISKATLWRWARAGLLPPKRVIGPNCVGWLQSELEAWMEERPKV